MAETQKAPSGRVKRQPVGQRSRLTVTGKDPNYEYRFVNDIGDRISMFQDAGYELVDQATHRIGDSRLDIAKPEGTHASVSVGVQQNGQGQRAYLMRIKKEWYDEDQAAKLERNREQEAAMKNPNIEGAYGKISTEEVKLR
jgi:hypothetical protein